MPTGVPARFSSLHRAESAPETENATSGVAGSLPSRRGEWRNHPGETPDSAPDLQGVQSGAWDSQIRYRLKQLPAFCRTDLWCGFFFLSVDLGRWEGSADVYLLVVAYGGDYSSLIRKRTSGASLPCPSFSVQLSSHFPPPEAAEFSSWRSSPRSQ